MHYPKYLTWTGILLVLLAAGCATLSSDAGSTPSTVQAVPSAAATGSPGSRAPQSAPTPNAGPSNDPARSLGLRLVADIPLEGGASRFDYQSIDPQRSLLFIAHLGAGQVIAFDLKQQQVAAYIPDVAGVHGLIAVPESARVYASATGSRQLAVIDETTFRVIARADAGQYPDGVAFDPENQKVFVSDESGGAVIVIDARTNRQTNRIDLGGEVGNTFYDAAGHRIISAAQGRNQLVLIDSKSETVSDRISVRGCDGPHGFYLDSADQLAYVTCEQNAKVFVVDLNSKKITAGDTVGNIPDVLAYDPGLHRLYVASESGVVTVFQTGGATLQKIGETYLAPNAHTVAVDPVTHRVYLPLENISGHPVLRILEPLPAGGK